jgi:hypothetical protein
MAAMFRLLSFLVALTALCGSAAAQVGGEVKGSTVPLPRSLPETAAVLRDPMVFYLAKGEPDACGQGCSEWIAAEGQFDLDAPQRLRDVLSRLAKRKLPIFFHSPGGLRGPAMNIGRILRERELTAGVSRTIPEGCVAVSDESCRSSKQSGRPLAAELHGIAACNSACVIALVGAKVRQVPPGARLGVHSGRFDRPDPDGRFKVISNQQIRRYLQEMQIVTDLIDVISNVPFEQAHYLSRDEIAAFGIDARTFQETRWMAGEPPPRPPSALKFVLEAKGAGRKELRASMIYLRCLAPQRVSISYLRGLGSDEIGATKAIKFAIDDRDFSFPQKASISKIDAIDTGGLFDTRSTYQPFEFFEAVAARDGIEIIESDPTNSAPPPRTTKLSTNGLSKVLEELRKNCGQPPKFLDAPGVEFLDAPVGAKR